METYETIKKEIVENVEKNSVACSWDTPENFVSGFSEYSKKFKSHQKNFMKPLPKKIFDNNELWNTCSKIISSKVNTNLGNEKEFEIQGYSNIIIENNSNDTLDVEDLLENMISNTEWNCKGCKKYFASKQSLHRHYDRKKSCKEISEILRETVNENKEKKEEKENIIKTLNEIPEKPYIIDYVDELLVKAISGDTEKPYCKHCDVEFANKSNLHKHLSKNIACDKLAKQELKLLFRPI